MATKIGTINPTGGPTGATGPTGPSGPPGSGGGGGGAAPVQYDLFGATPYTTGSLVYTDNGLYLATADSTGVNPDTHDPSALPSLAASTTHTLGDPAAHPRISRRFQVNADTEVFGLRVRVLHDYVWDQVSTDHFVISSTDPATTVTSVASGIFAGYYPAGASSTGNHIELAGLNEGIVTLTADTNYWLILADPIASDINTVVGAGFNTLSGTMSLTADTRYSDAVTGTGTTATAATFQFGFDLVGVPTSYWTQLSAVRALSFSAYNGQSTFAWNSGIPYHPGHVVLHENGIWYSAVQGLNINFEPAPGSAEWILIAWIVPAGGTTGQILTKNTDTDGDYGWASPTP